MVIKNCVITGQTSKVLKPFIGDEYDDGYKKYKEYHTGVDIECNGSVSSISFGEVLYVGKSGDKRNVIIVDEDGNGYNYSHLDSVEDFEVGDNIDAGEIVGFTSDFVQFEALYQVPNEFPVRVGDKTLYKYDPTDILEENLLFDSSTELANLRLQDPDKYDELLGEYFDKTDDLIEDDDANPPEDTGYDGDDDPDNWGSEDTGYPDDYSMPLDQIIQDANL